MKAVKEILRKSYKDVKVYKIVEEQQSNTNCLTYIPNDINLTLSNGTLTLKAGSKVYVPNGFEQDGMTRKFDVVTTTSDLTLPLNWGTANDKMLLFLDRRKDRLDRMSVSRCHGGTTAPSSSTYVNYWYDTTENLVKQITNDVVNNTGTSLPIAIFTAVGDNTPSAASIDHVFNGFGYIGNTLFGLPNVKGLIPNGKNSDGSNNCIETETPSVETNTYATWTRTNQPLCLANNQLQVSNTADGRYYAYKDNGTQNSLTYVTYYDNNENKMYHSSATAGSYSQVQYLFFGYITLTNGVISNMRIQSVQPELIPLYKAIKSYMKGQYYGN